MPKPASDGKLCLGLWGHVADQWSNAGDLCSEQDSGYFTEPLSATRRCRDQRAQGFNAPEGQALVEDLSDPDFTKPKGGYGWPVRWTKLHGAEVRQDFGVF